MVLDNQQWLGVLLNWIIAKHAGGVLLDIFSPLSYLISFSLPVGGGLIFTEISLIELLDERTAPCTTAMDTFR